MIKAIKDLVLFLSESESSSKENIEEIDENFDSSQEEEELKLEINESTINEITEECDNNRKLNFIKSLKFSLLGENKLCHIGCFIHKLQ